MHDGFIRINDVMSMTGLAKSTVWLWVSQNKLPKPIKLSSRVTVWKKSDINNWIEQHSKAVA
ncbi:MAG: AlpA family phage regulatory protein [Arcobacteraceae bacterium]|nr:AlpA family phage regulatory protein [Arcobacteraceae bacterium]